MINSDLLIIYNILKKQDAKKAMTIDTQSENTIR